MSLLRRLQECITLVIAPDETPSISSNLNETMPTLSDLPKASRTYTNITIACSRRFTKRPPKAVLLVLCSLLLLTACQAPQRINSETCARQCNYPVKPKDKSEPEVSRYVANQSRAISYCRACLSMPVLGQVP